MAEIVLPLPNLTVQQLEYLVAVSRRDTWAEAAASVGVTPSALSQGLAELERRVGVTVFDREGRRRVLTAAGREVLAHAEAVVARTSDLARWASGIRAGTAGQVRIGMIDAAAVHHLPAVLRRFRQDNPNVQLHLRVAPSGAVLADLAAALVDVAVCVAPPQPLEGVLTTDLFDEELRIYAPPEVDRHTAPSQWGPWVTFPPGSHSRRIISAALSRMGSDFRVVAESHQPEVLREMVAMGIGWTVLPVSQAESGSSPLIPARRQPLATRTLVLARRADSVATPAVEALATAISAPPAR